MHSPLVDLRLFPHCTWSLGLGTSVWILLELSFWCGFWAKEDALGSDLCNKREPDGA